MFSWLVSQPASNVFLSHQISINHQPPANQQYFSLTTNQHQLSTTASRTKRFVGELNSLLGPVVMHKSKLLVLIDAHKETVHPVLSKIATSEFILVPEYVKLDHHLFQGKLCLRSKQSFKYVPQAAIFCFSYKIRIN